MLKQSKISCVVLPLQKPLHVSIVRERRRSIALRLVSDTEARCQVPLGYSDVLVTAFLEKKRRWIDKQVLRLQETVQPPLQFCSGDTIWYLGQPLTLAVVYREALRRPKVFLSEHTLAVEMPVSDNAGMCREAVYRWLRQRAEQVFSERVALFSEKIGKAPKQVRVKTLRSKWGSCSSLGTVNLRWNLVMAPMWVLDYVVIHELCHLYLPHHRPSFWALVAHYCPNYLAAKTFLKENAGLLELPEVQRL